MASTLGEEPLIFPLHRNIEMHAQHFLWAYKQSVVDTERYYIFFMSVPLIAFCERIGRKKISPRFDSGNPWGWYSIVCRITTSLIVQYMIQPFQLLAFDWAVANWKGYYFAGHLACIVFYVVVSQLPTPKKKEA